MAGQSIIDFLAGFLIQIFPSPIIWALAIVVVMAFYMFTRRVPMSAASHFAFLLILTLVGVVGGVFDIMRGILYAISGGIFFLGLWQFIGRR